MPDDDHPRHLKMGYPLRSWDLLGFPVPPSEMQQYTFCFRSPIASGFYLRDIKMSDLWLVQKCRRTREANCPTPLESQQTHADIVNVIIFYQNL